MHLTSEERRQHRRYNIENSVSVSTDGIFQISDISTGGFCFRCPPYTSIPDFWDTDILTSVGNIEGIPVKRIRVSMVKNSEHEYLPMVVGVKFGRLVKEQDRLLTQLIQDISRIDNSSGQ